MKTNLRSLAFAAVSCALLILAQPLYAQNTETAKIVAQHSTEIALLKNDILFLKNEVLNLRNQNAALRNELLQADRALETKLMAQIPLARAPGEQALSQIATDIRPKLQGALTSIQTLNTGSLALKGQLQAVDTRSNFIVRQPDGTVNFALPNGRFQFMINGNFCYQSTAVATIHCWME